MNKPDALRQHLLAHVPELQANPAALRIQSSAGTLHCSLATSLSFDYRYPLQVQVEGLAGSPEQVIVWVLDWLRSQQNELLANLSQSAAGIPFNLSAATGQRQNLSLTLNLSERVQALRQTDEQYAIEFLSEPIYTAQLQPDGPLELYANADLLSTWPAVTPTDTRLLETPHPQRQSPLDAASKPG